MGTVLGAAGVSFDHCFPELCLSRADLVQAIHRAYLSAHADIIETNTFGANRILLERWGLQDRVEEINRVGVELARQARDEMGVEALVAGSIGPSSAPRRARVAPDTEEVGALVEQAVALEAAGADIFIFETFGDLAVLEESVRVVQQVCTLPIVAQATFLNDGLTISGASPAQVADALESVGVAALGANCTLGPRGLLTVIEHLARATTLPISVQPNAGSPSFVRGRVQYRHNEEYFARSARRLVELGVSIVGGCCGTTPRHTEAIHEAIAGLTPGRREPAERPTLVVRTNERSTQRGASRFREKLVSGEFIYASGLVLPDGSDPDAAVAEVALLTEAGADAIVIAETADARAHMSPVTFGLLVQERLGIEPILSAATWDKSMLGLQADLLGAHAFGIEAVLCTTGVPAPEGTYPGLGGVFEVTSIDLIDMLQSLNEARDHTGARIRRATSFLIGARVNTSADDLSEVVARTRQKIAAGAHFLVTDPVFDLVRLERFCNALGDTDVPLLLGVMAPRDYEHLEYLHHEVSGARVPDEVLARLATTTGPDAGRELVVDIARAVRDRIQGVVVLPSDGGAVEGAALIDAIRKGLAEARPGGVSAVQT
jgi:methionine synthase / methylenetetrahydrofolate reductase(NADPH)